VGGEGGDASVEERERGVEARQLRRRGMDLLGEGAGGRGVAPCGRVGLAPGVLERVARGTVHREAGDDLAVVVDGRDRHRSGGDLEDGADRGECLFVRHDVWFTRRRPTTGRVGIVGVQGRWRNATPAVGRPWGVASLRYLTLQRPRPPRYPGARPIRVTAPDAKGRQSIWTPAAEVAAPPHHGGPPWRTSQ